MDNLTENKKKLLMFVDRVFNNTMRERFESLFLAKNVKRKDLIEFLQVDRAYVSRIINGHQDPPRDMKIKIASFFSVDSRVIWE